MSRQVGGVLGHGPWESDMYVVVKVYDPAWWPVPTDKVVGGPRGEDLHTPCPSAATPRRMRQGRRILTQQNRVTPHHSIQPSAIPAPTTGPPGTNQHILNRRRHGPQVRFVIMRLVAVDPLNAGRQVTQRVPCSLDSLGRRKRQRRSVSRPGAFAVPARPGRRPLQRAGGPL